jgi:hypothetical protein
MRTVLRIVVVPFATILLLLFVVALALDAVGSMATDAGATNRRRPAPSRPTRTRISWRTGND